MLNPVTVYKRIVMYGDLNPAGKLYGGTMMKWIDEAGAIFGTELVEDNRNFVTLKVSELIFKYPAELGDVLTFQAGLGHLGNTSFQVKLRIRNNHHLVAECDVTFVTLDKDGVPTPHGI